MATTTYNKPKPFAWSYSKVKNFEVCPKKHFHVDIAKDFKEEESEQLALGNEAHEALANRIAKGTALPEAFREYEPWAARVLKGTGPGSGVHVSVEQKFAITESFEPCTFFDRRAWFRGVADVLKIAGSGLNNVALAIDWKTGKIIEDSVQLALMAQCVFVHYPAIQRVRTEFVWLREDATTREDFNRDDVGRLWEGLFPRIESMKEAARTSTYPPNPGRLCRRWCPVVVCPHHGVG